MFTYPIGFWQLIDKGVWPVDVDHSALIESAFTSTGNLSSSATIAFGFKPTNPIAAGMSDTTGHYLCLIQKQGTAVTLYVNGNSRGSTTLTTTTAADLLTKVMNNWVGNNNGYYSNMHVVDGVVLDFNTFYAPSEKVADLWVVKEEPTWNNNSADLFQGAGGTISQSSGDSTHMYDGILTATTWITGNNDGWTQYDFGTPVQADGFSVNLAAISAATSGYPKAFTIQGSNDGSAWTDLKVVTGLDYAFWGDQGYSGAVYASSFDASATYNIYRLQMVLCNANYNNTLGDFKLYRNEANGYGTNGGYYTFDDAVNIGNSSVNTNHWSITGTQSDDTPTHNGGTLAWESLNNPKVYNTTEFADIVLREGTGAETTISSLTFKPDWVNMKSRSAVGHWHLTDSVRGVWNTLFTSSTQAEIALAQCLRSFDTNGYTIGTRADVNGLNTTYADLALKADPKAGFDIVTYVGNGTSGLVVPHNLGKAPTFIIIKCLDLSTPWEVYHVDLGNNKRLRFNTDAAAASSNWNFQTPTSEYVTLGGGTNVNSNTRRHVMYLFTDSDVFKAFSYTGNALADGPEVSLNGRPLSIPFLKNTNYAADWLNLDTKRTPINSSDAVMRPNLDSAEAVQECISYRSNGFKIGSTTEVAINGGGDLHIGLAILRQPFKYSNAF